MVNSDQSKRGPVGVWPLAIVLSVWVLICVLSVAAYRPTEPQPESIPAVQFSAARAEKILAELVGDGIPHPAGSQQNAVVRGRIVSLLESFGYDVEIQTGQGDVVSGLRDRSAGMDQVELHNIIAQRSGSLPGKAIMVVSHYDSVAAGPGACDDGVGTAALLEIARMISLEPEPQHDLVFLITDGEELGMLGAKLFVNQHPLAKQIGVAINLEARGTTGPSCMFETSRMSRMLIPVFAGSSRKQFASSLFYEIYKRLPNDTDFSVLKKNEILGFNFAFIGNVENYHTTADNLENADRGSLQHHGENAMGLIRNLQRWDDWDRLFSNEDESNVNSAAESQRNEAVYFDVLGKWIVWWPSHWSVWLCVLALAAFAVSARQFHRTSSQADIEATRHSAGIIAHLAFHLLALGGVFAAGYFIQFAVRQDPRLSNPWPEQPVPILLGLWFASFAMVGGLALALSKVLNPKFVWISFCVIGLLLALAISVIATGASHLFIVPIIATSLFALLACWAGRPGLIATIVFTPIAVGLIWLPLERLFYDAVGFKMAIVMMVRISFLSVALLGPLSLASNRVKFVFAILMSMLSVASFLAAIWLTGV